MDASRECLIYLVALTICLQSVKHKYCSVVLYLSAYSSVYWSLIVSWTCAIITGTTAPVACPEGSWSNSSGLRNQADCNSCPGGFYCASAGLTTPTGRCSGGCTWPLIPCSFCVHSVHINVSKWSCVFMQILLQRRSCHTHAYWWNYRGALPRGLPLPWRSCATFVLWPWNICSRCTCY